MITRTIPSPWLVEKPSARIYWGGKANSAASRHLAVAAFSCRGGQRRPDRTDRMNRRHDAWLAWYMCAVSLMLTVIGLLLLVVSRYLVGGPLYAGAPVYNFWLINTVIAFSFSMVGGMIAPRLPPHNSVGWLFCIIGLLAGMRLFVAEYAIVTLLAEPGTPLSSLPGGEALAWVSSWLWVSHIGLFLFLALLFPDGGAPSSRWRFFAWIVGMVIVVGTVAVAVWPETAAGFAYAVVVLATSAILAYVVAETMGILWLGWISSVLVIVGVVGLPVAVGIAVLRYRLYNIDLIINRTLVYGSLTALLVSFYVGGIMVFEGLLRALTGQGSQLAIVASTLAVAALFNPLRHRIQSFIDRRFYRRKYDAKRTLEAFSVKLRDKTDLQELNSDLVGVIMETMPPAHISLWLGPSMRVVEDAEEK